MYYKVIKVYRFFTDLQVEQVIGFTYVCVIYLTYVYVISFSSMCKFFMFVLESETKSYIGMVSFVINKVYSNLRNSLRLIKTYFRST